MHPVREFHTFINCNRLHTNKEKWLGGGARDTSMKSWARMPSQFLVCPNLCLVDFLNLTWSTAILRTEISLVKLWPPHSAIMFGFSKLVVTVLTKGSDLCFEKLRQTGVNCYACLPCSKYESLLLSTLCYLLLLHNIIIQTFTEAIIYSLFTVLLK